MKTIKDILESTRESKEAGKAYSKHKDNLDKILNKCGFPKSEYYKGKIQSLDEDTIITFGIEEDFDNEPYIENINCKFYGPSGNTLKELNKLVDLYKELYNFDWSK